MFAFLLGTVFGYFLPQIITWAKKTFGTDHNNSIK